LRGARSQRHREKNAHAYQRDQTPNAEIQLTFLGMIWTGTVQ
jgi:hypothetical protein